MQDVVLHFFLASNYEVPQAKLSPAVTVARVPSAIRVFQASLNIVGKRITDIRKKSIPDRKTKVEMQSHKK